MWEAPDVPPARICTNEIHREGKKINPLGLKLPVARSSRVSVWRHSCNIARASTPSIQNSPAPRFVADTTDVKEDPLTD
jgi:hypothetical protein